MSLLLVETSPVYVTEKSHFTDENKLLTYSDNNRTHWYFEGEFEPLAQTNIPKGYCFFSLQILNTRDLYKIQSHLLNLK